jgi:glycerol-3-phosphate acyltransferase
MVMAPPPRSVVADLEGALLRSADTFPYFMLVAFEASGLLRFAVLLALWPLLRLLDLLGSTDLSLRLAAFVATAGVPRAEVEAVSRAVLLALWPLLRLLDLLGSTDLSLRLAAFVATAGVPRAEVEAVSRAVLPKFMADDVDAAAWAAFGSCDGQRVVVTRMPRVMAERFAKDHLGAHEVVGCELEYSRIRRSTGIVRGGGRRDVADRVRALFADDDRPDLGIGRSSEMATAFLPFCRVRKSGIRCVLLVQFKGFSLNFRLVLFLPRYPN